MKRNEPMHKRKAARWWCKIQKHIVWDGNPKSAKAHNRLVKQVFKMSTWVENNDIQQR